MNFKEHKKRNIQLDVTPLVDTVFNLLIFFALSLNFTSSAALPVNLPAASSAERFAETSQIVIHITRTGAVVLNQSPVSIRHLQQELLQKGSPAPHAAAIIQADEQVSHGRVVKVMDICRRAGFNKILIAAAVQK